MVSLEQPHSRQAEESLLGAILIHPAMFELVAGQVQAGDFHIHRHRWIWQAIVGLRTNGREIDILTVAEALAQAGHLDECGGPAYLTGLINATPTSLHAEDYAALVEQLAVRRRLLEYAGQVAKLAYDQERPLENVLEQAGQALLAASARPADPDARPLGEIVAEIYAQAGQSPAPGGLSTGFAELDKILGGLRPGGLFILAARPGLGKTSFVLNVALRAALQQRKRVAIFSLEMTAEELGLRLLAQYSALPMERIRSGRLLEEEWSTLGRAVEALQALELRVNDSPMLHPAGLRAACLRLQALHGLDLVVLDYLQLMHGGERFSNRQEEVSYISRSLKALAKELQAPVLAAAQLSRAVEQRADRLPQLADLRESGSIEQDADVVMFLQRDELQPSLVRLSVAKHRSGPTGQVNLVFQGGLARFESAVRLPYRDLQALVDGRAVDGNSDRQEQAP